MNWRPEKDWDATKIAKPIKEREPSGRWVSQLDVDLVEAGADAYAEALKRAGNYVVNYAGDADPNVHRNGWKVFIPDEEQ